MAGSSAKIARDHHRLGCGNEYHTIEAGRLNVRFGSSSAIGTPVIKEFLEKIGLEILRASAVTFPGDEFCLGKGLCRQDEQHDHEFKDVLHFVFFLEDLTWILVRAKPIKQNAKALIFCCKTVCKTFCKLQNDYAVLFT